MNTAVEKEETTEDNFFVDDETKTDIQDDEIPADPDAAREVSDDSDSDGEKADEKEDDKSAESDDEADSSDDSAEESDTDSDGEAEKEAERRFNQAEVDGILKNRVDQEKLKQSRIKSDLAAAQRRVKELEDHASFEADRSSRLQKELETDDLLPDTAKDLLAPREMPVQQQANKAVQYADLDEAQFNLDGQELTIRLSEEMPERGGILGQRVALMIQQGAVPKDIVTAAARHKNGIKALDAIMKDDAIKTKVSLAMYESSNQSEFLLKFSEIADSIDGSTKETAKTTDSRQKPKGKEPLRPKPAASVNEDDVVYVD